MNTSQVLADTLRLIAEGEDVPVSLKDGVLSAIADGLEDSGESVRVILAGPVALPNQEGTDEGEGTTAAQDTTAAAPAAAPEYITVPTTDVVKEGDEWKLKPGLRHRSRSKAVEWRVVTPDLIGRPISEFTKSDFRRKAVAGAAVAPVAAAASSATDTSDFVEVDVEEGYEQLSLDEFLEEGDEWKLKPGLKHRDDREVEWRPVEANLLGREVSEFTKSVFRRPI